jgi:hypothetical protein
LGLGQHLVQLILDAVHLLDTRSARINQHGTIALFACETALYALQSFIRCSNRVLASSKKRWGLDALMRVGWRE